MIIAIVIIGISTYGFLKAVNQSPKSCPVPEEVGRCDCFYNALGDKSLRYCFCYPGTILTHPDKLIGVENVTG